MTDEMYREHILDLYKHPHNFGILKGATHKYRGFNPLCGDDIEIQAKIKDGHLKEVHFQGKGCALSLASASLLTDKVKGMSIEEVRKLKREDVEELMMIPMGPVRIKCALLPLEAIHKMVNTNA